MRRSPPPGSAVRVGSAMSPALLPKSTSWAAPGAGITPDDIQASSTSKWIFTISISILSIYNAVELAVMVFLTFRQYRGLYFYSLLVAGLAIIPYELGFCLDLLSITPGASRWAAISLITLGWWPMVTGQAVVLWSRLHLILMGEKRDRIIRWTGWMIVINVVILHLPTTGETNPRSCSFAVTDLGSPYVWFEWEFES